VVFAWEADCLALDDGESRLLQQLDWFGGSRPIGESSAVLLVGLEVGNNKATSGFEDPTDLDDAAASQFVGQVVQHQRAGDGVKGSIREGQLLDHCVAKLDIESRPSGLGLRTGDLARSGVDAGHAPGGADPRLRFERLHDRNGGTTQDDCGTIRGMVMDTATESDGDLHIKVQLDPQYQHYRETAVF
jgi:hypothetical protein